MKIGVDVKFTVAHTQGSFVFPNPWQSATGRIVGQSLIVCGVEFGVSPSGDRIYVDKLFVAPEHRRRGYATSLLLEVVNFVASTNAGNRYPITALQEVWASKPFWNALRSMQIQELKVTQDIRISEMLNEAKRWQH